MHTTPLSAKRIAIIEAYKALVAALETLGGTYDWTQIMDYPPGYNRIKITNVQLVTQLLLSTRHSHWLKALAQKKPLLVLV